MTSYFINELINILVFILASLVLAIILFVIVYIITFNSKVDYDKSSSYECGFSPFSETGYRFEIQFFLIAVLFLLFDVEILYLFPIVTSLNEFTVVNFTGVILFFILLAVGLLYEISRHIIGVDTQKELINKNERKKISYGTTY